MQVKSILVIGSLLNKDSRDWIS